MIKIFIPIIFFACILTGCNHFLDSKPQSKLVIPQTLDDCQALLDDYSKMNSNYPSDAEASSDNYYLNSNSWDGLANIQDRQVYVWDATAQPLVSQWANPYRVVYNANLVLQTLEDIHPGTEEQEHYNNLQGAALFFRAYAFQQLAQLFSVPYLSATAVNNPGIPLRLSPDLDIPSKRGTLQETYDQILSDLHAAVALLSAGSSIPTRPNKAAAYAALARTYLSMQDYPGAENMANACLDIQNTLLDYNTLNKTSNTPFAPRFNAEVIFHSVTLAGTEFATSKAFVDSTLLARYEPNDLRRNLFFRYNSDSLASFKGSYDGTYNAALFNGLAVDEIYLIKAECQARAGETEQAMETLNHLLVKRWVRDLFVPLSASNAEAALRIILDERRKELLYRGLRWSDLRRLNQEPHFAITLARNIHEQFYQLPPNDLRYTLLLPQEVISTTTLQQNKR